MSNDINMEHAGCTRLNPPNHVDKQYTEKEKHNLVDKESFSQKLAEYYKVKTHKKPLTKENLIALQEEVQNAKEKTFTKDRREYFILKTYDIVEIDGKIQVIRKKDGLPLIPFEDLYDTIFDYHIKTNHGGKTKMEQAFRSGKVNVPRPATEIFLLCCGVCHVKRSTTRKPTEKPKYTKGFSHKGQIDIIDFHSIPNNCYTTVLCYQDHHTKFLVLRPLENDSTEVIARELFSIFMTFGAPKFLESYNGKYFISKILSHLKEVWSETIIAHGEPKDSNSPNRTPDEIEDLIRKWMESNLSNNWLEGLSFVQWQENISYNHIIGRSPYHATFGIAPRTKQCKNDTNQLMENISVSTQLDSTDFHKESMKCNSAENIFFDQDINDVFSDEDIKPNITISDENISIDYTKIVFENSESRKEISCCDSCGLTTQHGCEIILDVSLKRYRPICNECATNLHSKEENRVQKRIKSETVERLIE